MNNRRNELLLVSAKEYCKCIVEGKTIRYNQKNVMPSGSFTTWTTIGAADVINGHKYLIHNVYSRPSNDAYGDTDYQVYLDGLLVEGYLYGVNVEKDWIMTCTAQTGTMYFLSATYDNFAGEVFYQIMVIDLTALGLDNITNANEFYQTDLGKYIAKGYYLSASDNAFLNANAPIHFKGVNLWNEQWQNGYYATGTKTFVSNDSWICSKNEIKVNSNTKYFFKCSYYNVIYFFNDDTYIDSVICTDNGFTTPYNCNNILFMTNIATYNHDICISENKFVDSLTQGTLSGFANTTPRQFEEGKYYAGLTDNNYYYASYISNLSVNGGKISFQTSSGGYGVGIPFRAYPNRTYYLDYVCSITEDRIHVSFFDKDGNYLSYVSTTNNLVTTPANCYWVVLVLRPTENTYAVYNDIVVKESSYQKYCGTQVLENGLILQKGDTYKSWNGNLTRTMKEIDLRTLAWTYASAFTCHIADLDSDLADTNAITEKYNEYTGSGFPPLNHFQLVNGGIVINTGSSTSPSGKALFELLEPITTMWQTLDIQDYHEFVETDPHIYKLNRDLSDYGILDITSDNGTKMSNLTQLNILGGDGDFCYQDGFIYQKSSDIENVWIYQIQISNAPSRMVSRRTISVESDNGVDLDFTKE